MSGARAPDANVNAFLKRVHELNMAKAYCDQTDFVSRNAEFAEKGTLKVIAATRAERRSCSSLCPLTPARRLTIDTTRASKHDATTPTDAASLTGTVSYRNPTTAAPAASNP